MEISITITDSFYLLLFLSKFILISLKIELASFFHTDIIIIIIIIIIIMTPLFRTVTYHIVIQLVKLNPI